MAARAWALDPALPPSDNFDLSHWKLQLPVDANGTNIGNAAEISVAQLLTGHTNSYFYTGSDGAMTFWAPDNGATTSGSSHPRSELREMLNPSNVAVNWKLQGMHILSGQCKVLQAPADSKGDVCIGQIHGHSGAGVPLLLIHFYTNSPMLAYIRTNATNPNATVMKKAFDTSALNSTISYRVIVENGLLTIVVNGVTNSVNLFQTDPAWATNDGYFKAGNYNQTDNPCNCATDGAKVAFYSLTTSHAPSITNQPTSRTVLAGTNTTFNVAALGNGTLSYQWWFNSTNVLTGATNASLTLADVQPGNAGNYSVAVTDSLGSVTSLDAALTVSAGPPPALAIQVVGTNAILSWPSSTDTGFMLESTASLLSPTWSGVGAPVISSNQCIVTNGILPGEHFYRLKK